LRVRSFLDGHGNVRNFSKFNLLINSNKLSDN
jgi:hypothetical protein